MQAAALCSGHCRVHIAVCTQTYPVASKTNALRIPVEHLHEFLLSLRAAAPHSNEMQWVELREPARFELPHPGEGPPFGRLWAGLWQTLEKLWVNSLVLEGCDSFPLKIWLHQSA